jgi:hypothetical protein
LHTFMFGLPSCTSADNTIRAIYSEMLSSSY